MRKLYRSLGDDIGNAIIALIFLIISIKIIIWAWHIHWLFGLLMLLLLGGM